MCDLMNLRDDWPRYEISMVCRYNLVVLVSLSFAIVIDENVTLRHLPEPTHTKSTLGGTHRRRSDGNNSHTPTISAYSITETRTLAA